MTNPSAVSSQFNSTRAPQKPKQGNTKGHETVLNSIQYEGRTIFVTLLDGDKLTGQLIAFDRYTLSVKDDTTGNVLVVFKHAIKFFRGDRKTSVQ